MDQVADAYPVVNSPIIILRDTFAIVIYDTNPTSFAGQTVTALKGTDFQFQAFTMEQIGLEPSDQATAAITVPQSLFNGLNPGSQARMVYNIFLNEGLFVRRQQYLEQSNQTYSRLGSIVISARVAGRAPITDLQQLVEQSYYKNPVCSLLGQWPAAPVRVMSACIMTLN